MKAIDHFDTGLGVKFSTYAVPMIMGEIRNNVSFSSLLNNGSLEVLTPQISTLYVDI